MDMANYAESEPRWSLLRGRLLLRVLRADPTQEYLVYAPRSGGGQASILASVHGLSHNAYEQARLFAPYCEKAGLVLVVPKFSSDQHRDYQRLGRGGRGVRADLILNQCISEVASLTGADATRVYLFGYSGGAQFAHRYLMAHPHRVMGAVVVAAGWYTFPDHRQRFPYGIRPIRLLPGVSFNPEDFLRVPVQVLVGARDTGMANLRRTVRTNTQQGLTRVERARNWSDAMRAAARSYGIMPAVKCTEVPDVDHSFKRFCQRGALLERAFSALLGGSATSHPGGHDVRPPASESAETGRVRAKGV